MDGSPSVQRQPGTNFALHIGRFASLCKLFFHNVQGFFTCRAGRRLLGNSSRLDEPTHLVVYGVVIAPVTRWRQERVAVRLNLLG